MIRSIVEHHIAGTEFDQQTLKKLVRQCLDVDPYVRNRIADPDADGDDLTIMVTVSINVPLAVARQVLKGES